MTTIIKRLKKMNFKFAKAFIIIFIGLLISFGSPSKSYSLDNYNTYKVSQEQKENLLKQAKVIDWAEANKYIQKGDDFVIVDYKSGVYVPCVRGGGSLHADIETTNKESTELLNKLNGDSWSWKRRGVLVILKDGTILVASIHVMPHAGLDNEAYGMPVDNRSGGFKDGINYDYVKNNGMDGHICLHFKNSKTHVKRQLDPKHQENIKKIEKEINRLN